MSSQASTRLRQEPDPGISPGRISELERECPDSSARRDFESSDPRAAPPRCEAEREARLDRTPVRRKRSIPVPLRVDDERAVGRTVVVKRLAKVLEPQPDANESVTAAGSDRRVTRPGGSTTLSRVMRMG